MSKSFWIGAVFFLSLLAEAEGSEAENLGLGATAYSLDLGFPFTINDGSEGGPGSLKVYEGRGATAAGQFRIATVVVCNESDADMVLRSPNDNNEPSITVKPSQCAAASSYDLHIQQQVSSPKIQHGRFWIIR